MNKLLLYLLLFGCFYSSYASSIEAIENPPLDLVICDDDTDGFAFFDLTVNDAIVLGSQNPADFQITYHVSQADADSNVAAIPNPSAFLSTTTILFVRVEDITDGSFEVGVFNLIVNPIPDVPSDLGDIEVCGDGAFAVFDLTVFHSVATGGDPNLVVTYFESLADFNANIPIPNPTLYTNVVNPQLIYVKVTDIITSCNSTSISTITLIVHATPIPIQPALFELCDNVDSGSDTDELAIFDLSSRDAEITGGDPTLVVSYHLTQSDADDGINVLPDMYQNVTPTSQTIWVRVEDAVTGCYELTTLTLVVNQLPSPSSIEDVMACDDNDDGIGIFDLTALIDSIQNGETSATLSFHETQESAEIGTPAIVTPAAYASASVDSPQTLYVRATDMFTECFRIITITLITHPSPPITTPLPDLIQCNDGSNQAVFDLTDNEALIIGILDPTDFTVTYHESQIDATNDILPIGDPVNYLVITPGTVIWTRLQDETTSCFSIASFDLIIADSPILSQDTPFNYTFCEESDGDDSQGDVDLTTLADNANFLAAPQNSSDFNISYHNTAVEAEINAFPIDQSVLFTVNDGGELFFRIENSTTGCIALNSVIFNVETCPTDTDNDGVADQDEDINNNGDLEDDDTDNDSIPNYQDDDDDGDLVMTIDEITGIGAGVAPQDFIDTDDDTIENYLDDDDDGDSVLTINEDYNNSGSPLDDDTNDNGIPDFLDPEVALSTNEFEVTHFSIYPNPAINQITITATIPFEKIRIYDITGKVVKEITNNEQIEQTFAIGQLKTGLYFIGINTSDSIFKLLKM